MEKQIIPGDPERRRSLASRTNRGIGATTAAHAPGNHEERRLRAPRRMVYDRRQLIRFEDDRRVCRERRTGNDPWAFP